MTTTKRLSIWTWLWLAWLLAFLGIEIPAALLSGDGTLSRHTWDWFSLRARKRYWLARRLIFGAFWALLIIGHFYFQASAVWTVILPGIPFAAVIVLSSFVWKDASSKEQVMPEVVKLAPEYDWKKTLWKGLRPALIAGGVAFLAALAQSVDVQWLVALGVPSFLAVFIAEAVRNYVKQHGV